MDLNQAEDSFPAGFFASSGPRNRRNQPGGEKKGRTMNRLIQCKRRILPLLIAGVLACFGHLPKAEAVVPAPDGGYPGANTTGSFNTAVGGAALYSNTTGGPNTAAGYQALNQNTIGSDNTATGYQALYRNTTGMSNTATGFQALLSNSTGFGNTANGSGALDSNTTGSGNTAIGEDALDQNNGDSNTASGFAALADNTTGHGNTASGYQALLSNTIGSNNTANGAGSLFNNTAGNFNTAIGVSALNSNTMGGGSTAIGYQALANHIGGDPNTATGYQALYSNTTGYYNTADGSSALNNNTTGNRNTAAGHEALRENRTGLNNTATGYLALVQARGSGNPALGSEAGVNVTTASNVICVGNLGANVSNSCFIGHVRGVTTANANAVPVLIDSAGQLGTVSSSRRFKKEVRPMDSASESVLALKPVTFQYKTDNTNRPEFGLIAEEVAEVNPNLVVRDENGEIYTVRYDAVNAMLLNEFLKEHRKVEQLTKDFESKLAEQQKQSEALTAAVQKVSAQLEVNKPAPQTVLNNQ